ncbi:NAD(P)H dehydrogenase (quinone) [Synchytrium endobioticum]|uniref:NAD(P)H dehydrogenase (Quinone) n=1 Tax=Synchytrium endobioticum TaxID=286115 RepID=A0A507C8V7_9FUNG|nr:NAD(P)H dehydrogenase (quinone) [Synchytrium endobioticum]
MDSSQSRTGTPLPPPPAACRKPLLFIVYYSVWGHIKVLADAVKKGIEDSGVANVEVYQVSETLPQETLDKMYAMKFDDPVLDPHDLAKADGFIFGVPTRFGSPATQIKTFWDATGSLWQRGALIGKHGAAFTSSSTQHGGQETTIMTFLTHFVHHGVIYVPLGYSSKILHDQTEVIGGSPWGAGTITGNDGSKMPSQKELELAVHQGKFFASVVARATR